MDLTSFVVASRPIYGGIRYLTPWRVRVVWARGSSVASDILGVVPQGVHVSFLFEDGGGPADDA